FVIDKTLLQPIMPLAYPVLNSQGEIDSILIASFSVGWLDDFLKKCQLPPGTHVLLVDRQGAILANYPHTREKVVESPPQSPLIRAMLDRQEGFVEAGCPVEGIPGIFAFTPVEAGEAPLKLAVGFEKALVLHRVGRDFLFHLSLLVLAAGLALTGSLAFGHLLVRRPVLRLLKAARRVAAGDLEARTGLPAGKGELNSLGQAFDEMAAALQQRRAERRQAEEALHRSEQKYRVLVSQIPAMVFQGYGDWSIDPLDEKVEALTGYSKEDFDSRRLKWCDLIPAEDLDYASEVFIEALKTDKSYVREHRLRKKDGEIIWVQCRGQIFLNDQGKVDYISGVSFDVTRRRQAEEALRESEKRFRDIAEHAAEWIWEVDAAGKYTYASPVVEKLLGFAPHEILEKHFYDLFVPEDREELKKAAFAAFSARQPFRDFLKRNLHKNGDVVWLSTSGVPILDHQGNLLGYRGSDSDVTDRRQAEEALRDSEARFRNLLEYIPGVSIQGYGTDGTVHYWNKASEEVYGYTAAEALGKNLSDLIIPADLKPLFAQGLELGAKATKSGEFLPPGELMLLHKNGSLVPVYSIHTAVCQEGRSPMMFCIDVDLSARKQLEEQFLQAQKMEAVGALAGGIAHDFNNILAAILGNIGLAALDDQLGPRGQNRLAQAEAACLRAQALSQQLLIFAKGGAPVKKLFSVAELHTESTAFTCVGSPVRCETNCPENLWWIEADPGQIGQVFQNLTINAVQAMPTGGTIKVGAENLTLGTDSDMPLSAGKYIKISVGDQGMGIPADHLPRIFDPYFTTKQQGSGLGLASAYAIIEKHRGHIAVESKPGVGTTFHIYLPAVEPQATLQPEEDRELLVGKGKVLVMDDEEMVREVLGRMLARLGYEAEFAGEGGEAIEIFVQAQGAGQAFAAVILDLTVPGGMGGKEAMARLREIDPQVKAVVSSGYSDDPVMADFQKYGFSGVIAKPYRISALGKILHQVVMGNS
ncbi:MAG: PAS domain S-box protein, partial [Deltaproteobacteria bacterium]|nr:PAS domain S-box protein [Deltaproteobacteria bacterium]